MAWWGEHLGRISLGLVESSLFRRLGLRLLWSLWRNVEAVEFGCSWHSRLFLLSIFCFWIDIGRQSVMFGFLNRIQRRSRWKRSGNCFCLGPPTKPSWRLIEDRRRGAGGERNGKGRKKKVIERGSAKE